jgi:hypothetical protein
MSRMLTCDACVYQRGTTCLHHKVTDMDPSRRCRFYRNRMDKRFATRPLEETFRLFKKVPPRPNQHLTPKELKNNH